MSHFIADTMLTYATSGVGRNVSAMIAQVLDRQIEDNSCTSSRREPKRVSLVTMVGRDESGRGLIEHLEGINVDAKHVIVSQEAKHHTARYSAVHAADGELIVAVADMSILDNLSPKYVREKEEAICTARLIVIDANLPSSTVREVVNLAKKHSKPLFYEPTSGYKSSIALGFDCGHSGHGLEVLRGSYVYKLIFRC